MRFLLDTHLLIWALDESPRLPKRARALISDDSNDLYFSAASVWEIAIKQSLSKTEFKLDAHTMRRVLLENGYLELPVTGAHATGVAGLPKHHTDPFDRLLIAQAAYEELQLLTHDRRVSEYSSGYPVRYV